MAATSYYNAKTGTGWRRIQTGPNKGKYQAYKNFKPTNRIKSNLTLGSGAAKFISKNVKKVQSTIAANSEANRKSMIGKGTAKNPEFITNKKGRKVKNPGFKPPTMVANKEKSDNKKKSLIRNNTPLTDAERIKYGIPLGTTNADAKGTVSWHKNKEQNDNKKGGDKGKQETAPTNQKVETKKKPKPTNVFTKHYKTGEELGVMTRAERTAYEKDAGQRTWESEKERLGAKGKKQNTKASSKSWRKKAEERLAQRKKRKEENVFTA